MLAGNEWISQEDNGEVLSISGGADTLWVVNDEGEMFNFVENGSELW